ncbi:MAG TPA: methyltransferase domain-containing protein [Nitrospiria bacterium]|nr:methyltransferase domain-containing protein [Nitrospiria bacterium]
MRVTAPHKSRDRTDLLKPEKMARVYSTYSGFYDLVFGKFFQNARLTAINLLELEPGNRVLEVGVGTGLALPIYPRDCDVVGIDITEAMLRQGEKRVQKHRLNRVNLQQMDATRLAFGDNRFDSVMAAYVISTVPDPKAVLDEMMRVCKPGGKIVLLNHFSNGHPLISRLERKISPLCSRMGFRSDLPLNTLLDHSSLQVEKNFRVNPFQYWHIVQCTNSKNRE